MATEKYIQAVVDIQLGATQIDPAVEELRIVSSKLVNQIVSGDRGVVACRECFSMIVQFNASLWEDLNLTDDEKYAYVLFIVVRHTG